MIATLILVVTFFAKSIISFFVLGFMAMWFLWPSNEQPVATTNKVMFGLSSLVFIGWMFNFYTVG